MKINKLNKGDIIVNNDLKATVIDPNWKGEMYVKVKIKNSKLLLSEHLLDNWNFENPIKDNRIVSDKTFAIRLRDFVKNTQVVDACSHDEKNYLLKVSEKLLRYQIETATDKEEIEYLKSLDLWQQ